jgi:hypothetical protein
MIVAATNPTIPVALSGRTCRARGCSTTTTRRTASTWRHRLSTEQIEAFLAVFPQFSGDRLVLSHNCYNDHAIHKLAQPTDVFADHARMFAGFMTQPVEDSGRKPEPAARRPGSTHPAVVVGTATSRPGNHRRRADFSWEG